MSESAKNFLLLVTILLLLSTTILIGGCAAPVTKEQDNVVGIQDEEMGKISNLRFPEFILGVGDSIDITVYREKTSESILGVGDSIDIVVYRHSDLNQSLQLDTSGIIMFPLIGDVQAAGKHVIELRDEIQHRLSKYFVNPQVTINVTPIERLEIDDLALSAKIGPTGKITFPLIGDVQVAGKGVFALRDEMQERLSKYFVNPQVTINVTAVESQKVHILGEVRSPRTLTLDQKMLVWEGISRAGGFTTDANEKNVLLVRSEKGVTRVTALKLDIRKILKNGKLDQDVYLKNGDIVYVPPSFIANVERFMVRFHNIINPFVTLERGIIFGPEAYDVLRGKEKERPIIVSP